MTNVQEVPMKISLIRSGEVVEVRRRRLVNPSYEVVEKVASEVCSGKYRLQYTDEDGDVVTMSSQEEWEECLASWNGVKALQLRVELCGPRGLGRRSCRDRSRSRTPSPHRHHRHGHRSRSVSSGRSGRHHRWGRRSQSPPSSRHTPLAFPCSPNRFQSWLAKMEQAYYSNNSAAARCCRSACRSRSQSLSRSVSPHRHHHHGRTRSLSAGCKRWARSLSPSWSRHIPLMAQVFQAWLEKARRSHHRHGAGAHVSCEAPTSSPTGQKCANCDFQTTGLVDGFCCKKCMRGRKCHGKRCEQTPFVTTEQATGSSDEQQQQQQEEECPTLEGHRHPFLLRGFPFGAGACAGGKGMHGHGKGKGMKGRHSHCGRRMQEPEAAGSTAAADQQPEAEQPVWGALWKNYLTAALDGMHAHAKGMHGKGKGSKGGRQGGKGCRAPAATEEAVPRQATEEETPTGTSSSEGSVATGVQAEPCVAQEVKAEAACEQVPVEAGLDSLSVSELRKLAKAHSLSTAGCLEKRDLTTLLQEAGVTPAAAADAAPSPTPAPSQPQEEKQRAPHPFARQIAHLAEMGFPVNPQLLENLAASNGDLAAVLAGLFAQQ